MLALEADLVPLFIFLPREYLTGFRKRKTQRKKKATSEKLKKEKEAIREVKRKVSGGGIYTPLSKPYFAGLLQRSRDRLEVRTLRCGRNNPGSNPGLGTFFSFRDSRFMQKRTELVEKLKVYGLDRDDGK